MPDGDKVRVRVSPDGQVELPLSVRERHGWTEGTVLELEDGPDGVKLAPVRAKPLFPPTRPEDVFGMLAPYYSGPPVTIEEMDAAITAEVLARHARGRY